MNQKKDKTIIGLVGEKFSGKDTIANFLVEKHGAFHVRFSHLLDEILNVLALPISRRNEIDLGLGLRKIFGERVLGTALIYRVRNSQASLVVINGIRMDEMVEVKKVGAIIVYITASPEVRFARYQQRHEKVDDATMSYGQFLEQEKERTEIGIPELGRKADLKIENDGTVNDLYEKTEQVIGQFIK